MLHSAPPDMPRLYRRLVRPMLFRLDAEDAHTLVAATGAWMGRLWPVRRLLRAWLGTESPALRVERWGIHFPRPVGVAAGLDKAASLYPLLAAAGFGFVEQGTFTAEPQAGNPRPRLFRFTAERAIVNRMGFNNPGAAEAARRIARQDSPVPRGISVGKGRHVALADAAADQARALAALADFGDYHALNVSSPNTPGLRDQQAEESLRPLVHAARGAQEGSARGRRPLLLKLAPDFGQADFERLVGAAQDLGVDGLILTNTTLARDAVPRARDVAGGLSGAPLRAASTGWIRVAHGITRGKLPIIGVGGVFTVGDALEKILAGASLLQVYTGYVFEGPGLPRALHRGLAAECRRRSCKLTDLVGAEATA